MTLLLPPFRCPGFLHGGEDTNRLQEILSNSITSFEVGGISLLDDGDGLPTDDKLSILVLDSDIELAMGRVILKHVDHVVEVSQGSLMAMISTLPDPYILYNIYFLFYYIIYM